MSDRADASSAPAASVVVATRNRSALLGRLLDALEAQDLSEPFEVVVVDDASTDDTPELLAKRAAVARGFTLVALSQETNRGPATARNRGWRTASAPVVCFTDDDCIPDPGWVRAHLAAVATGAEVVQGRTMPVPAQKHRSRPFSRSIQRERDGGFYETCNMAYRREVLEEVGGFDETFRFPFGEDTDLAWRAIDAGHPVVFTAAAEVHHEVWPFDWRSHKSDIRRHEGLVQLVKKHPHLRELFPMPWCVARRHSAALATVGALAVLPGRPRSRLRWLVAVGAGANYFAVCWHVRWHPPKRKYWPGYLAAMLASDLAEVGVMAASSVKYRTFLL